MVNHKKSFDSNDSLMYRPFPVDKDLKITIKREHYSTSLDGRGYIPVYEYLIDTTPIMWDRETGYIHFTGIWKALGNSKSDIVKMVDSNPDLGTKKIRGGFLRIQGTWIPYKYAYLLCTRTAWKLRHQLTPIFGPKFLTEVLEPNHKDFGRLVLKEPEEDEEKDTSSQKKAKSHKKSKSKAKKPYTKSSPKKKTRASTKKSSTTNQKPSPVRTLTPHIDQLLLNEDILSSEEEDQDMDEDDEIMSLSDETSSLSSFDSFTPTPTFRVVETYPSDFYYPNTIPVVNTTSAYTVSQDIIDTISATILLQRLSQDDGVRPFNPLESSYIPSKVIVGEQEFTICWD